MSTEWDHEVERLREKLRVIQAEMRDRRSVSEPLVVPSLPEFVLSPEYLAQPLLYPSQLTLLRAIFCDVDGLTSYDRETLASWGGGFSSGEGLDGVPRFVPTQGWDYAKGTSPDVIERMRACRAAGRRWLREVNLVIGRRGGKGHIAAIATARFLYELLALGDPQAYFQIASSKRLLVPVFAANREQARFNLFADVAAMVAEAPCFQPFIVDLYRDRLLLSTPAHLAQRNATFAAAIEVVAKESTSTAGRGPATPAQLFDEMAYVDPATSSASADAIYSASTPALDTFDEWSLLIEASSPSTMTGEFYAIHQRALEIEPSTGTAAYPDLATFQLPSWEPYANWERATEIPLATEADAAASAFLQGPAGTPRCFPELRRPIAPGPDSERMLGERRAKPIEFRSERLAQWRAVTSPYLEPHLVDAVFAPYQGKRLGPVEQGRLNTRYVIAIDPSSKHDAFAWVVGHAERDSDGLVHVVVDLIRRWVPPGDGIDLDQASVLDQLEADIRAFRMAKALTDQYGGPWVVQDLNRRLGTAGRPTSVVRENPRSRQRNLATASTFRERSRLRAIHCYHDPQMERELSALQEINGRVAAPTSGPTQSDDQAIALMELTVELVENDDTYIHDALSNSQVSGYPGIASPDDQKVFDQLRGFHQPARLRLGERRYPGGPRNIGW